MRKSEELRARLDAFQGPPPLEFFGAAGTEGQHLFNRPLMALHWAAEAYTARVALGLLLDLGLEDALRQGVTLESLAARYSAQARIPLAWILPFLADEGLLEEGEGGYRLIGEVDLGLDDLRAFAEEAAPGQGMNFDLLDAVRRQVKPFFTEGRAGEGLLFDLTLYPLWLAYFNNANLVYAPNNGLPLLALRQDLPQGAAVMELGAGAGSFARLVASRGAGEGWLSRIGEYQFTDVAPAFLRKAQRDLPGDCPGLPLSFHAFDLNRETEGQGVAPGSLDAIVGINVLHVADDLLVRLRRLRALLKPGGRLIVGECLKTNFEHPLYIEFLFNFLRSFTEVTLHPELRPQHGFLTPECWVGALRAAGFSEVVEVPPARPLMARFPTFNVGAFAARNLG